MELAASPRLGDILVAHGAIARTDLEILFTKVRGRLGDWLRAYGAIDGQQLARALADQYGLAHVNLLETPPEKQLFCPRDKQHYIRYHFVPYRHRGNVLTLATSEPSEELQRFAEAHYRCVVQLAITTPRELAHVYATRGATNATRTARLGLRRRHKHLVADRIILPHQLRGIVILLAAFAAFTVAAPTSAWISLIVGCNLFYLVTLLIKLEFYRQGVLGQREQEAQEETLVQAVAALDDATLPTYSILVPMYKESAEVMARLIGHLEALDYPKEKLDIKLICEADDVATLAALKALRPPEGMSIIAVPPSFPRTKPKACNVALRHARGEYVVIYDAEDAPAPDQLKRAVAMFRAGPENVACLQASLNYYNRDENTLTQLFSIEYSALFKLLLPGLMRMGIPIPLGGTSNHLRMAALRDVCGWDAFNVTEDADLGIRLHYFGYETRTLPSLTLEESPIGLRAWMKQRTRWIKGYIQTWLVYTRDTRELKQRLGRMGYYGFQFFVGAPALTFLLAPFLWAIFVISLTSVLHAPLSPALQWLCAISFAGGILSHWLFARKVIAMEGWKHMRWAFMLYPFYWLLHSIAAARALWQLVFNPHYWDKTRHGVSRLIGRT